MKRCPECRRDYYDDTLLYCLDDGNALLEGPASVSEPATAIMPAEMIGSESATRRQILTTDQPTPGEHETARNVSAAKRVGFVLVGGNKALAAIVVSVLVIGALGYGGYRWFRGNVPATRLAATGFDQMKITKLTDTGKTGCVAMSSDGKYVVHSQIDGVKQSLWMRHVATDSNVQIVPPSDVYYFRMTFSPEGNFIYFVRRDKTDQKGALYRIPVLGGEPLKVLSDIGSSVTFSPDGKQIAFMRTFTRASDAAIMIANADGTNQRQLVKRTPPEDCFFYSDLAWSPDGKRLASSLRVFQESSFQLVEVSVEDGWIKPINGEKWLDIGRMVWLPDGSGLVAPLGAKGGQNAQIYLVSYPGGESRRITNDTNVYDDLSLSGDGTAFVTMQNTTDANLVTLAVTSGSIPVDETQTRQITNSGNRFNGAAGLALSPDGRIVYTTYINGKYVLWISDADGTNPKRLIENESFLGAPAVSPDGRYIVVEITGKGNSIENLWRMDTDGSGLVKLTNGMTDADPSFTPDGRWVVYRNNEGATATVKKVSIEGGETVSVFDKQVNNPEISPDGKWMLGSYRENENEDYKAALIPFGNADGTAQKIKMLDISPPDTMRWLPDGRAIVYTTDDDNLINIWILTLGGGAPKQMTSFKSQFIANLAVARDGKSLVMSRGTTSNDVVLISNFK